MVRTTGTLWQVVNITGRPIFELQFLTHDPTGQFGKDDKTFFGPDHDLRKGGVVGLNLVIGCEVQLW